jgi:hypothetical protein
MKFGVRVMKSAKIFIIFTFLLAFAVQVSAQGNPFPNELKGYKFFANGKLKNLRLGVSTKEDVKKIFGENCEKFCDYDSKWKIRFSFVGDSILVYREQKRIDNKNRVKTITNPLYLGKLFSITLFPKSFVSMKVTRFSFKFTRINDGIYVHGKDAHGKDFVDNSLYDVYFDKYGLEYSIVRSIFTTNKSIPTLKKGDLFSIKYQIPNVFEKQVFIEQK